MSPRRPDLEPATATTDEAVVPSALPRIERARPAPAGPRADEPRSADEAERAYVAAREAWTGAMRAAASGRPADMAALAIAQEAYEAASLERQRVQRLESNPVAITIEREPQPRGIDAVIGQEMAWRDLKQPPREGLIARIRRLLGG